jgi:hypothetical protein
MLADVSLTLLSTGEEGLSCVREGAPLSDRPEVFA